jgi:predicted nucleic acid-binding protein
MLWAIRQELLSGVRDATVFRRLRDHLRAFADEPLGHEDYERAAEHFNTCRAAGVQGSNTDFLLCAVAERRAFPILTTDADFTRYAALVPVKLHPVEDAQNQP